MKRFGVTALMLFAFIVGFASTYSCGGGSSATAGGDADTLEGYSASAFALSTHNHPEYATTALLSSHTHTDYADSNHVHSGTDITYGTVAYGRLPIGTSSASVAAGNHSHPAGDATTLDGLDSSDFADSSHSHANFGDLSGWWTRKETNIFMYPDGNLFSTTYSEVEVEIIHSGNSISFRDSNSSETTDVTLSGDNYSYYFETTPPGSFDYVINGVVVSDTSIMGNTFKDRDEDNATYTSTWFYQKQ